MTQHRGKRASQKVIRRRKIMAVAGQELTNVTGQIQSAAYFCTVYETRMASTLLNN